MPLKIPSLDDRTYQQLLDETLARIPVHNPEWTNFNQSDPGVTLIQLFAFLTEALLYRSNQIPERNRRKFLSLLGLNLQPAASARGLVTFTNERGPIETTTLPKDLEVRAGQMPFRTVLGLDVLPVEARVYFKRAKVADPAIRNYYKDLYAALNAISPSTEPVLYETVPLETAGNHGVKLGTETVDGALWIALLVRADQKPFTDQARDLARAALANKALTLGFVPQIDVDDPRLVLPPGGNSETLSELVFELPSVPASGRLGPSEEPSYRPIHRVAVPVEPKAIQVPLPAKEELDTWRNLDPLEAGAGEMPPALPDPTLEDRVVTWLRVKAPAGAAVRVLWVGINCAEVLQRAYVVNEQLPPGNGEPDQSCTLSKRPVISETVRFTVADMADDWKEIEDLLTAGPEVPAPDARHAYGLRRPPNPRVNVFTLDPEAGVLRFGDGTHGRRPPLGALMRASYAYGVGSLGNVGKDAITSSPALGAGFKVTNPIPTWGGADAESVTDGERQITRQLQHRDRLVTARDFEVITRRTPGVDVGRVDVIPVWNPQLTPNQPGDAPGAVTLMLIPRHSATQPDAPEPDEAFLGAVCRHLDSRRLVTTELILSGPEYKPIWVSAGINVAANQSFAEVRVAVEAALRRALSPLPADPAGALAPPDPLLFGAPPALSGEPAQGWPRHKPVDAMELYAVVARVAGVFSVNKVLIAAGNDPAVTAPIPMTGLELPRLAGLSVTPGDPVELDTLRGLRPGTAPEVKHYPVPFIPKEC